MPLSKSQTSILIGNVFYHAGSSVPTGALEADGSAVSRTMYPQLFGKIGTTYGSGDGSTTFNLPDIRGIFIRGSGSQTISSITYTGTLGTKQGDQMQGHVHSYTNEGYGSGSAYPPGHTTASAYTVSTSVPASDGSNGTPRTGSETRPANIGMTACIWALPVTL